MQDATVGAFGLRAGLATALVVACGNVSAEPIVAFGGASNGLGGMGAAGGGGGTAGMTDGSGGGSVEGGASALPPILGLCDTCETSEACGDRDDSCLVINIPENAVTGTLFCARDCLEDAGCPTGYGCNQTDLGTWQCAPRVGSCSHRDGIAAPPPLAEMREALSDELDVVRNSNSLTPLTDDPALDQLAQESVEELAREGIRFGKYQDECRNKPACTAVWAAEQQVQLAEFGLTWSSALPSAVAKLQTSPSTSGLNTMELLVPTHTRVGIGIVMAGDEAFFSIAYGP